MAAKKPTRRKRTTKAKTKPRKKRKPPTFAPMGNDVGVPCVHCGEQYGHHITHTYPNGNRRRKCGRCEKNWVARRDMETTKEMAK